MIHLSKIADLSDDERAAIRTLSQAVYPADTVKDWPGRHIEWSQPEWCVRIHGDRGVLASYVGVVIREGTLDGQPVKVGGIGGVMTHPAERARGLAGKGIRRAVDSFRKQGDIAFGLLVCEERLLRYYGKLGWRGFLGQMKVRQRGADSDFTFNHVMTLGVAVEAPIAGTIDLCGPPW